MTLIEEAESLMLHQFANSPRLNSLIKALVRPFQEALDSTEALNHGRYIDDAYDSSLDIIGSIVGQSRNNMSDEDFRSWINVRILLNKNTGTAEEIFAILSILFGIKLKVLMDEHTPDEVVFTLDEHAPNVVLFTFYQQPHCPTNVLFSIIRSALPLGITCKFMRANFPSLSLVTEDRDTKTNALRFDVSPFSDSYFADFYEEDSL